MNLQPFHIHLSDEELRDLRARLLRTRWPDEVSYPGRDTGISLQYMQDLVDHWLNRFDWRAQERMLNELRHFKADVAGTGIHFVYERGRGPKPLPIVLTHGWPGSFDELLKVIPLLTDPARSGGDAADAFDVVVPSMPGFGFSDKPTAPGTNVRRIASIWADLMSALGYKRFIAQGGDFGAGVSTALGLDHADRLLGIHLNYIPGSYRPFLTQQDEAELTEEEKRFFIDEAAWYEQEGGYDHVQFTKPQTITYPLHDSPVGLAAWLVEKFILWVDRDGDWEKRITRDDLLRNVMIYWATGTIGSSMGLYLEAGLAPLKFKEGEFINVPCAIAHFPKEAPFPPRRWIERGYNVRQWTTMPRGGHFAAMEEPQLFVEDIRRFARRFR